MCVLIINCVERVGICQNVCNAISREEKLHAFIFITYHEKIFINNNAFQFILNCQIESFITLKKSKIKSLMSELYLEVSKRMGKTCIGFLSHKII